MSQSSSKREREDSSSESLSSKRLATETPPHPTNWSDDHLHLDATWLRMPYDFLHVWEDKGSDLWNLYVAEHHETVSFSDSLREHLSRTIGNQTSLNRSDCRSGYLYPEIESLDLSNLKKRRLFVDSCVERPEKLKLLLQMMDSRERAFFTTQLRDAMTAKKCKCSNRVIRHIFNPRFKTLEKFKSEIAKIDGADWAEKYM